MRLVNTLDGKCSQKHSDKVCLSGAWPNLGACNFVVGIVVKIALDKATIHQENTYINKLNLTLVVTAKMATPTKVDSKLSDAHLESLERRKEEKGMPLRPSVESSVVGLHKRFYLVSTR